MVYRLFERIVVVSYGVTSVLKVSERRKAAETV